MNLDDDLDMHDQTGSAKYDHQYMEKSNNRYITPNRLDRDNYASNH